MISSELLSTAVLTPMAADLGVTKGAAGQSVNRLSSAGLFV
jgi:DHA1 family purine ribonucleoside efflux pump-like MFS transporter